jgi:hypothetical protein
VLRFKAIIQHAPLAGSAWPRSVISVLAVEPAVPLSVPIRCCVRYSLSDRTNAPTEHLRLVGQEATQNDVQAAIKLRGADVYARFLIPHLRPGAMVLDCGCGAGTITLGLAEAVPQGQLAA